MDIRQLLARRGLCGTGAGVPFLLIAALAVSLSLACALPALAQTDTADAGEAVAEEEWVYLEYDWANCGLSLPPGGQYPDPASVGLNDPTDPMVYPLVWLSEGQTYFDSMILGIAPQEYALDEFTFQEILGSFHGWLLVDFPEVVGEPHDVELANGSWNRIILANSETGLRATVYTIYEGANFYALSFASGLDLDMDDELASQEFIVEGFYWPSQYLGEDEYYDEDY